MERLTFEGNFCDIAQCKEIPCPYNGECSQRKVWERLAAYEETGLTPERCAEFARADAEGRYIVMRDAELTKDGVIMTDCSLPECLACPDFVDKAQDDLETFYGRRADNG